jgi:hypothetical protein
MKHKFNKILFSKITKMLMLVNQIDFQSNAVFGRGHTLSDLKWEQTFATTLDVKT